MIAVTGPAGVTTNDWPGVSWVGSGRQSLQLGGHTLQFRSPAHGFEDVPGTLEIGLRLLALPQVPFERTVLQNGKRFVDVHIREYKFNTGITPEQLSKKP